MSIFLTRLLKQVWRWWLANPVTTTRFWKQRALVLVPMSHFMCAYRTETQPLLLGYLIA